MTAMTGTPVRDERRLGALLARGRAALEGADDIDVRLEAELLLGHAAGLPRSALLAFPEREVEAPAADAFHALVERRRRGEPLAYLVGQREFYGLALEVTPEVLVPRPESELLVDTLLELVAPDATGCVLDLGTGSGALALAIKHARGALRVVGADVSLPALEVARRNGERLGIDVEWRCSDWFAALGGERFDVIVCNPPYVVSADPHFDGPLRHEPRLALDGGEDGLDAYQKLVGGARPHLQTAAQLLLEHGYDQQDAVAALACAAAYRVTARLRDLGGLPRALVLQAP